MAAKPKTTPFYMPQPEEVKQGGFMNLVIPDKPAALPSNISVSGAAAASRAESQKARDGGFMNILGRLEDKNAAEEAERIKAMSGNERQRANALYDQYLKSLDYASKATSKDDAKYRAKRVEEILGLYTEAAKYADNLDAGAGQARTETDIGREVGAKKEEFAFDEEAAPDIQIAGAEDTGAPAEIDNRRRRKAPIGESTIGI